jgi:Methyltransferase domain
MTKAEFVRKFIPSETLPQVGASFGHFLAAVGQCFNASGVELNPTAVEWSRSAFQVRNFVGSVYAIPPTLPAPFDVVAAWDVIEHLDEPRRALTICRSVVFKTAWMALSVDTRRRLVGLAPDGQPMVYQDPVQHVNLFSRANLTRLLNECGFHLEAHTYFGRRYRVKYVLNRLEYVLQDHSARDLSAE